MRNGVLLLVCFSVLYMAGFAPLFLAMSYMAELPQEYREWCSWLWMLGFISYFFFAPHFILERVNDVINRRPRG